MVFNKIINHSFFRYFVIGGFMFFVDFGTYSFLVFYLLFNPLIAHPIGVFVASTIKFFLNKYITFKIKHKGSRLKRFVINLVQYLLSLIVLIIYILLTELLLSILINIIHNPLISKFIVVIIGVFFNYFLDKLITFNHSLKELVMKNIIKLYRLIKG